MSVLGAGEAFMLGAADEYAIQRSLRFDSSSSSHLSRTPSSAGDRKTWTWSGWVKRSGLGVNQSIFGTRTGSSDADILDLFFANGNYGTTQDALTIGRYSFYDFITNAVFRDISAWYHIVLAYDTTQATAANRIKLYVNGDEQTFSSVTYPALNAELPINRAAAHKIGGTDPTNYLSAYLADVHFIDGQALAPTAFGKPNDDSGVWEAKKFTGSHNVPAVGQIYSGMLTSSNGFQSGQPATAAFDGDLTTKTICNNSNDNYLEFTPTTPISFTNGVHVYAYAPNGYSITNYWSIDLDGNGLGSETTFVGGGSNFNGYAWIQVATGSGTLHKLRIRLTRSGSQAGAGISAIAINGTATSDYLVDGTLAGVNGFHLDFSDNSSYAAIGTDSSSNNNTWTVNNINGPISAGGTTNVSTVASSGWVAGGTPINMVDNSATTYYNSFNGAVTFSSPVTGYFKIRHGRGASGNCWNIFYDSSNNVIFTSPTRAYAAGEGFTMGPYYVSGVSKILSASDATGQGSDGHGTFAFYINDAIINTNSNSATSFTYPTSSNTDSFIDTPTNYDDNTNVGGNYCTFNSLTTVSSYNSTLSDGNLTATASGNSRAAYGTIAIPASGKYYFEVTVEAGVYSYIGVSTYSGVGNSGYPHAASEAAPSVIYYGNNGNKVVDSTETSYGSSYGAGDVIGVAVDADSNTIQFYKNGTAQGSISKNLEGAMPYCSTAGGSHTFHLNCGQRPFVYSPGTSGGPSSDFKSICTTNLSEPTIADGSTAFDVALYDGNGSTQTISGLNFSPSWVWLKIRNAAGDHGWWDILRGTSSRLNSASSAAEDTTVGVTAFNSDGFTVGGPYNSSSNAWAAWAWDAGNLVTNSAYNQSQAWSSLGSGDSSSPFNWESTFDGDSSTYGAVPPNGQAALVDFSSLSGGGISYSSSVVVTYNRNTSAPDVTVNGSAIGSTADGTDRTYTLSGSGTLTSVGTQTRQYASSGDCGIKKIVVDSKELVDPGIIPAGSLNSSVYNQDVAWSNGMTVTSGSITNSSNAFNGNTGNYALATNFNADIVVNLGNTLDGILEVYGVSGSTHNVNGQTKLEANSSGWHKVGTCTSGTTTTYTCEGASNAYAAIRAIRVAGKILVDQGTTPAENVPTIASTCRANPLAGMSIVSFKGNATTGQTIGHGLNAKPGLVIVKNRDDSQAWLVWHESFSSNQYVLLNSTNAVNSNAGYFGAVPTSLTFTVGNAGNTNGNNQEMIAYCFAPSETCSINSYIGNGSADGPFVYTGMRPAFLMIKRTDAVKGWMIIDSTRNPNNVIQGTLYPNKSDAEYTGSGHEVDFLSNGFKCRSNNDRLNANAGTYLYLAFAENPFSLNGGLAR